MTRKGEKIMNVNELWFKYDDNRNPIYYIDEECKHLYTGHVEEYYNDGTRDWEADVVDGIVDGVYKEYTEDEDNVLEVIEYEKYSLGNGLSFEFHKNGYISSVCIVINNYITDCLEYNEKGELCGGDFWENDKSEAYMASVDWWVERLNEFRTKFDLEIINEEILRDGKNFDYMKYFR
jgi:antitoxin component YwqK of YwqJK toxin-antitoxin module